MANRHFVVSWIIDVEGIDPALSSPELTPDQAARAAAACAFAQMRRPRSADDPEAANVFEVRDAATGERWSIDLGNPEEDQALGPRVVGVNLQGGVVQDVFTPDPDGLRFVVIDYDTEGADFDDLHAVRQDDGDWSAAIAWGQEVSVAPVPVIVPHPDGDHAGPLVRASFADHEGKPRAVSFTLPPTSDFAAAREMAEDVLLTLNDDCELDKLDMRLTA